MTGSRSDIERVAVIGADKPLVREWVQWLKRRGKTVATVSVRGDEGDRRAVEAVRAFQPQGVCVFPALSGGIAFNRARPADLMAANTRVDLAVLEIWRGLNGRMIYVAASCVYPVGLDHDAREEDLWQGPLEPISAPYAVSKLWGITALEAYRRQDAARSYAVVIPATIYGCGFPEEEHAHVIEALAARFLKAAAEHQPSVTVWGSGRAVRDFLHRDDLFEGVWALMHTSHEGIFNMGSGRGVSIAELAQAVAETAGYEGRIVFDPSRPDGAPRKVLDITRAEAMLGWRPNVDLKEGLRRWFDEIGTNNRMTPQGGLP